MKLVIDIPQGLKIDFENENWSTHICAEMKNALQQSTPLSKGKWIPCSERKPTASVRYQVTFESGEVGYADFIQKIFLCDGSTEESVWKIEQYYEDDGQVIAWMELPEPYKEVEENK